LQTLTEHHTFPSGFSEIILTNGIVPELNKYRSESKKTWKDLLLWILVYPFQSLQLKKKASDKQLRG